MLSEAFEEFSFSRFRQFEEIPIAWNMQGKIQADLNEGVNNLREENPGLAETDLTAVIDKDSSVWQAYYYRGVSRKQLEKYSLAVKDLQHALKLNPGFYEGYVELAKVYFFRRAIEESERMLKKAVQVDGKKAAAHYLRGDINLVQGQRRLAIRNYEDCLTTDSLFHDARMKLVVIDLIEKKNNEEALQKLNRILQYDSLQKNALMFRAVLLGEKNADQCIRDLSNLIIVSPFNLMARYLRGTQFAKQKKYDQAFNDFQKLIKSTAVSDNEFKGQQSWQDKKIDLQNVGAYILTRLYGLPENDALKIKQAFCQIITAEFVPAITILNQVTNAANEPLCLYLIAVANEHKGDHKTAYRIYSMALKIDDQIADANKKAGIYEQNFKAWQQSVAHFDAVLRITPDAFITYKLRGVSYYYLGQVKEAIADYNHYLAKDSTDKEVIGYRGMCYLKDNQRLNAYDDFAVSENLQAFNFNDMLHLLDSVLATGDTTKALYHLEHFTKAADYFTEGYVLKFRIYMNRQEWDRVKKEITHSLRNIRLDATGKDAAYLLTLQGMVYAEHHHTEDAIQTFTEAIKRDKTHAPAYLERAKAYHTLGKESKAKDDFEKASALSH